LKKIDKFKNRDRGSEIFNQLDIDKLPFKVNISNLNQLGIDIADDLSKILHGIALCPALKWCLSTVKKAKVFNLIFQANERSKPIYKEEIAKLLPEYSYKTIASIIDEGVARGYYIPLDPISSGVKDKKVKNIRPSIELITAFFNWNIERISIVHELSKKYKK
jgi:hypothetical protein